MSFEIKSESIIEIRNCPACGIVFGMYKPALDTRKRWHRKIYCPDGCEIDASSGSSTGMNANERIESLCLEVNMAENRADQRAATIRGLRGEITKLRKRLARAKQRG